MNKGLKFVSPIILPLLFIFSWQLFSIRIENPIVIPSVDNVVKILMQPNESLLSIGSLVRNTWISILRVGIGYTVAAIVAIPLGMFIGYFKKVEKFLMPFLSLFRPIAPLAWVPLVLAWFGVASLATLFNIQGGELYILFNNIKLSMIFIIFIGAFFPILTNSIYGVKSVRNTLIDSALTLGAKKIDILIKVLLPASLPSIVTGLRVGLGVAWMCLVSAEMLPGSLAGIGYLITHAYTLARTDIVIAGMISISLVGGIFDNLFHIIEVKFFSWQRLEK
ncbi:ABC transporter permease [Clostridium formicaceticum]|uniref:Bicarbonate transport system permease protein CmpB n=1 Tax=Clostridium formicaceticum TaxID=1497 RepID=A0AAC9WH21_9CLOT|nr:ABC transporter permease [Clostridium formicaceticum]ARE88647.1 Bicarbonate transport system permease protein CmpB [Clostridium formicaceticum]